MRRAKEVWCTVHNNVRATPPPSSARVTPDNSWRLQARRLITFSICSALGTACTVSPCFITLLKHAFSVMCTRYISRATRLCQSFAHLEKCVSSPMYCVHCSKHNIMLNSSSQPCYKTCFSRVREVSLLIHLMFCILDQAKNETHFPKNTFTLMCKILTTVEKVQKH